MRSILAILLYVASAVAQQPAYSQCGGIGWAGGTVCVAGWVCTILKPSLTTTSAFHYQCLPDTPPTPTTSAGGSESTRYPGSILQSGYYWFRADEDPNFHKYLQTNPEYVPGTAILDSYTTAGQFQIVNGQLVELVPGGQLYANVEEQADADVVKLAVTFKTTQNTYGRFSYSKYALEWSVATINRPDLSAWLVCDNQQLFINLGLVAYNTPAGCVDQTIQYYTDARATS